MYYFFFLSLSRNISRCLFFLCASSFSFTDNTLTAFAEKAESLHMHHLLIVCTPCWLLLWYLDNSMTKHSIMCPLFGSNRLHLSFVLATWLNATWAAAAISLDTFILAHVSLYLSKPWSCLHWWIISSECTVIFTQSALRVVKKCVKHSLTCGSKSQCVCVGCTSCLRVLHHLYWLITLIQYFFYSLYWPLYI